MYGVININGQNYIERPQFFPVDISLTANGQTLLNQRLVLPGYAPFRLKTLTREVLVGGTTPSTTVRFKFALGNTDGGIWYSGAGVGGTNGRVVDTLIFGTGQFPFVLTPPIFYDATASITYEIQDISNTATANPYTISLVFGGAFLLPVS